MKLKTDSDRLLQIYRVEQIFAMEGSSSEEMLEMKGTGEHGML